MIKPLRAHKNNLDNLDTSVSNSHLGSRLLVSGQESDMWLWQALPAPGDNREKTHISQDCEVMGYVISGRAYSILEPLTAIKTSHPPAGQIY